MTAWGVVGNRAVPEGERNRLGSAVDIELREHVLNVGGDGLRRDEQIARNLGLASSARQEVEHIALTRCQAIEIGAAGRLPRVVGIAPPPEQRWDPSEELAWLEWLHDVVVGPDQQPGDAVECLDPYRGNEDERKVVAEPVAKPLQTSYPVMPESSTANRTRHGLTLSASASASNPVVASQVGSPARLSVQQPARG